MNITLTLSSFSNPTIYENYKQKLLNLDKKMNINVELNLENYTYRPQLKIQATAEDITFEEFVNKIEETDIYIFKKHYRLHTTSPNNFNSHFAYTGYIDFTLEYNLLIIGNGFDIGHNLKTKYADFLNTINILNEILNGNLEDYLPNKKLLYDEKPITEDNISDIFNKIFNILFRSIDHRDDTLDKTLNKLFNIEDVYREFFKNSTNYDIDDYIKKFKERYLSLPNTNISLLNLSNKILKDILSLNDSVFTNSYNELIRKNYLKWFLAKNYIQSNTLIQYFLSKLNNLSMGNNWIDIENELSKIIRLTETIIKDFNNKEKYIDIIKNDFDLKNICVFSNLESPSITDVNKENFLNSSIYRLETELNQFIFLLENYLINEEMKLSSLNRENAFDISKNKLQDIASITPYITHLLSFNYTDTFRKIYSNLSDENVDFIHGKLGKHNLVLGIPETLTETDESIELSCIKFKKYYQRIFKKTGSKYDDWIKNNDFFNTVYIYGHSLDATDKEILLYIIDNVKKVIIFYFDKTTYSKQIINLVKILGKQKFLKYVSKTENRIEFIAQTNLYVK